jgi:hypothetical protein
MVRLLARVAGIGIEIADLLVHELLLRNMRDRRAVAPNPAGRRSWRRRLGLSSSSRSASAS